MFEARPHYEIIYFQMYSFQHDEVSFQGYVEEVQFWSPEYSDLRKEAGLTD